MEQEIKLDLGELMSIGISGTVNGGCFQNMINLLIEQEMVGKMSCVKNEILKRGGVS
jgi:hypothetical protein